MVSTKLLLFKLMIMSILMTGHKQTIPSEFYSSVVSMELLLKSELAMLDRLDTFIRRSEEMIELLKRDRDQLHRDVEDAAGNSIAFVSNPISAFLMTKRLVKDYRDIDALIREGVGVQVIDNKTILPTEVDIQGVAEGLSRIQDIYKLEASELAKGNVNGCQLKRELNVEECCLIGRAMAQGKCHSNANKWFQEALQRWKTDDHGIGKLQILDKYSNNLYESHDFENTLEMTNPAHAGGLARLKIIEEMLKNFQQIPPKKQQRVIPYKLYEPLCRGDYQRPVLETSQLNCRYQTSSTAFLQLAPLKEEVINLDPLVTVYHDVVSDREIFKIIELAKPRISRATVRDGKVQKLTKARTSQNAWLTDEDDPVVTTLTRRVKDMTGGMDERSYEMLQVNNYGIGGHYLPHFDWSMEKVPYEGLGVGNRIATVMFYLSDVEVGGATVFPRLGLAVFPRKGSAILWYNLFRNGQGDRRTIHAACPVMNGSKWVANQWIHEYHQEFVRRCELGNTK